MVLRLPAATARTVGLRASLAGAGHLSDMNWCVQDCISLLVCAPAAATVQIPRQILIGFDTRKRKLQLY